MSSFLLLIAFSFAQNRIVTGKVTDARDGSPLVGVSVNVKGSKVGTTTDGSGLFRISVPSDAVLVFSNVGFTDEQVTVGTSDMVTVTLKVAQKNLQEVVITGYSLQNKRQTAGSISKVSGDEIKLQPVGSFDKALQGKVPGLLSQSQSGQPGAAAVPVDW